MDMRGKSGGGPLQDAGALTEDSRTARSVLECASPLALWAGARCGAGSGLALAVSPIHCRIFFRQYQNCLFVRIFYQNQTFFSKFSALLIPPLNRARLNCIFDKRREVLASFRFRIPTKIKGCGDKISINQITKTRGFHAII